MALRPQYFLPFMHTDGRVLGLLSITPTTYNGNETTVTISSKVYPVRRITYKPVTTRHPYSTMDFMAITVTPTEYRRYWQDRAQPLENVIMRPQWYAGQVTQFRREVPGDLDFWLLGGAKNAVGTFTPPTVPGGSNVSRTWSANSPFSNAPYCQFFDINWQVLSGVTNPERIVNVVIGTPSADPGSGNALKAVLIVPANMPTAQAGMYSGIRIVRVSKDQPIPTGTYTWPITIYDAYGQTSTLNVSVVVA